MKILVLAVLLCAALTVKPPTPVCRTSPLPSQIPITVGEELRFDLEAVFSGYNLMFNGSASPHISVALKYNVTEKQYGGSYNFVSTKIRGNNRFVGLVSNGAYSGIALGINSDTDGVTIQDYIQVQDIPNLHCYDADEIIFRNDALVVVDCAVFHMGVIAYNEFLYVNITTKQVIEGSHLSDTFVDFHSLTERKIEILEDPFTRMPYLFRFNVRDGLSRQQKDLTYAEIFLMRDPLKPQLLDVIDNTYLELQKLSIADYQIHNGLIYILVYNRGIYQLRFTRDQHLQIRSILRIQLDITRFRVDQLGFNDDLNVVATNGNTIYQFQWDLMYPPTLVAKYNLIPGSTVKQIFTDYNFVVASVDSIINDELVRRTWIFTRRTLSYLSAYNVFHAPLNSPHIIHWDQHGRNLQIFHLYNSFNIKMQLPYLDVKPVDAAMAGKTEEYTVLATSVGDGGASINCTEKFTFIYLAPGDTRVMRTGLWYSDELYVDSPDEREIPLSYEFFGFNLTYNTKFQTTGPAPFAYVDKQHKAVLTLPPQIDVSLISYFQMFTQVDVSVVKPDAVYGLVQTGEKAAEKTYYTTYFIKCRINVFDRDETHHLTCNTISDPQRQGLGKILITSQIFDTRERRIAIVFENTRSTVFVYDFEHTGFIYYGMRAYTDMGLDKITGVAISRGKLFVVLEYNKRVDVFSLDDINEPDQTKPRTPQPRFSITSNIMRFFGVEYFAPVNIKVSRFHGEAIFLKTKTGVMAININEDYLPELLFQVPTTNIRYDFELNEQNLLIITEQSSSLYQLQTPLRRVDPPMRRQTINVQFKIGQYDEVCSDRLFYIVGNQSTNVINPRFHSTSAFYADIWVSGEILNVDAVNIADKEILFIRTKNEIVAHVFAQDPKLYVDWPNKATDFKLSLSASNTKDTSDAYSLQFNVLDTNETIIKPTDAFDKEEVKKLGKIKAPMKNESFNADIQLNDSAWFQGNVLRYFVNCSECDRSVHIINHVTETRELVEGKAIYDMESTVDGIYAQQYYSLLKTHAFNSSIHFISNIPTTRSGDPCQKLAVGEFNQYVISLCESTTVQVYITSVVGTKPFSFGPYDTDAKKVNHAKIVGDVLMIVDNDDNPFLRAGGIYLYHLNFDFEDESFISLLDYIDYADLQIEGFSGTPYVGSADLHLPYFSSDTEYRLFISEAGTGAIFVFGFEISDDGEEIVYLSKRYLELGKLIPKEIKCPTPLKVHSINIHHYFETNKTVDYYLLLSVANWHHIELMITLNQNDDLLNFKLERLFERFPWTLGNYLKFKRGRTYDTYFAVPYVDPENPRQVVLVYFVPYIIRQDAKTYAEKYSPHKYQMLGGIVPLLGAFGSHWVRDASEVAFAFHTFGNDKLLFTDVDGYNITELTLFKNVTLHIRGLPKSQEEVNITAQNPYTNYTFAINLDFYREKDEDEKTKEEILWIAIIAVGGIMIIGLIIAFARQQRKKKEQTLLENKQSLLTVNDQFKNNYIDINRSSADPDSVRGSVEPPATKPEEEGPQEEEEFFTH